ncbi:hypothetical protein J2W36_004652 [Variovorax ginsengisoli]|uniref:Uncharacterized protein n=1 Tax=Variovorax ginsengisoli TaxID=363844 RepID=A0ABT9SDV0_9BURK|nr:hypothetical protein [Variovorax ginsengisoli]
MGHENRARYGRMYANTVKPSESEASSIEEVVAMIQAVGAE